MQADAHARVIGGAPEVADVASGNPNSLRTTSVQNNSPEHSFWPFENPMPIVSLRDFLGCGRFGFISLGVDRGAIENTFGQPEHIDATSVRRRSPPAIMKYGDIEFHFQPDTGLWLIFFDRFSGPGGIPVGWGGCQIDPWVIKEGMPRAELERELAHAALPYVLELRRELEQERLVLSSGVKLSFEIDPDQPQGLASVFVCQANRA